MCYDIVSLEDENIPKYLDKHPQNFVIDLGNGSYECMSMQNLRRQYQIDGTRKFKEWYECKPLINREIAYTKIGAYNRLIRKPDWMYEGIPPGSRTYKFKLGKLVDNIVSSDSIDPATGTILPVLPVGVDHCQTGKIPAYELVDVDVIEPVATPPPPPAPEPLTAPPPAPAPPRPPMPANLKDGCALMDGDGDVVVPAEVTEIHGKAFEECYKKLKKIDLSNTQIKILPKGIFHTCTSLEEVLFPPTLQYIGENAFYGCTTLRRIDLSNTNLLSIGWQVFGYCGMLEEVVFPKTLNKLSDAMFEQCVALKKIDLSNTQLQSLRYRLFTGCIKLSKVVFPPGLTYIGPLVFQKCLAMEEIDFSETPYLREVESEAFKECENLKKIDMSNTMVEEIDKLGCKSLEEILFPRKLDIINGDSFKDHTKLKKIDLRNTNIRDIGTRAFKGCTSLMEVLVGSGSPDIPSLLSELSNESFAGCTALKEIDLRYTKIVALSDIGPFAGCTNLKGIGLPVTLRQIQLWNNALPAFKNTPFAAEKDNAEFRRAQLFRDAKMQKISDANSLKSEQYDPALVEEMKKRFPLNGWYGGKKKRGGRRSGTRRKRRNRTGRGTRCRTVRKGGRKTRHRTGRSAQRRTRRKSRRSKNRNGMLTA